MEKMEVLKMIFFPAVMMSLGSLTKVVVIPFFRELGHESDEDEDTDQIDEDHMPTQH